MVFNTWQVVEEHYTYNAYDNNNNINSDKIKKNRPSDNVTVSFNLRMVLLPRLTAWHHINDPLGSLHRF